MKKSNLKSRQRRAATANSRSLKRGVRPLSRLESAKVGAAILLLKRGDVALARRVILALDKMKVAEQVMAYVRTHSKYQQSAT